MNLHELITSTTSDLAPDSIVVALQIVTTLWGDDDSRNFDAEHARVLRYELRKHYPKRETFAAIDEEPR